MITKVTLLSTLMFAGSIIIMKFKIYGWFKTFKLVLVIKIKPKCYKARENIGEKCLRTAYVYRLDQDSNESL